MQKILVISNDKSFGCFCNKLNESGLFRITVQCVSDVVGKAELQYSAVLIDFELIRNGGSVLVDEIYTHFLDSQILPVVKETTMGCAQALLKKENENLITLPCCVEYLNSCISKKKYIESILKSTNLKENGILNSFIGISQQMLIVKEKIIEVAKNDMPVLILGPTGVGKSYIAKFIHSLSKRNSKNFVSVNTATMQENLVDAEMFGSKTGAFTDAISKNGLVDCANNGTLFLDEIGCIKVAIQAKLLDVVETGEYRAVGDTKKKYSDIRLICATNATIKELKNSENFRIDLYYRISGVQICIPELKERREDIVVLAFHFLEKKIKKSGVIKKFRSDAVSKLQEHDWPGNVRELKSCVERAFFMSNDLIITERDINFVL